jgi:hypothetical protein
MTTTSFALVLGCIVASAFIIAFALLSREERFADREFKLRMKMIECNAILKYAPMFRDAKELTFQTVEDGKLKFKMSRRDHAPLPPQYITPTIVPPQALYGGGVSRMEVLTGSVDRFYANDCDWAEQNERKKVKNYAEESRKYAEERDRT